MAWGQLTLCTDSDLGALEPEATNGHWRSVTWPNQRAEAKRDLKIWLERDYAHIPGVADKVKDTVGPDTVWGYTGSAYSDLTSEASNATESDINLATVFTTFGTDRLYVGSSSEFDGLSVAMHSTLNAVASTLSVRYWGAAGWTALTVTNGTLVSTATFGKSGRIVWTIPSAWERSILNGSDSLYWIELSVSAALTASTRASQILPIRAPDGLKRICALRAMGYIYLNLAAQAPSTDYWNGRASNQFKTGYWDRADALYESLLSKGGIPIDVNDDNVISPDEANQIQQVTIGRA
jgi:hypothetical protein